MPIAARHVRTRGSSIRCAVVRKESRSRANGGALAPRRRAGPRTSSRGSPPTSSVSEALPPVSDGHSLRPSGAKPARAVGERSRPTRDRQLPPTPPAPRAPSASDSPARPTRPRTTSAPIKRPAPSGTTERRSARMRRGLVLSRLPKGAGDTSPDGRPSRASLMGPREAGRATPRPSALRKGDSGRERTNPLRIPPIHRSGTAQICPTASPFIR